MFFKKATKINEIFTVYLTLCSKRQIDGEDFVNFCGLLRKHELYLVKTIFTILFYIWTLSGRPKNPSIQVYHVIKHESYLGYP